MNSADKYLSAFDLDKTLLRSNISFLFSKFLYQNSIFSKYQLLYTFYCLFRFRFLKLPIKCLHKQVFRVLFKGKELKVFERLAESFISSKLAKELNPAVLNRLNAAQRDNHHILLLSSSPEFLVRPIAKMLNIQNFQGTSYEVDPQGHLKNIRFLMTGSEKASILFSFMKTFHIQKSNTIAYSDNEDDLPFLQAAGIQIGVNPTKKLRKICRQNNWEILTT